MLNMYVVKKFDSWGTEEVLFTLFWSDRKSVV